MKADIFLPEFLLTTILYFSYFLLKVDRKLLIIKYLYEINVIQTEKEFYNENFLNRLINLI